MGSELQRLLELDGGEQFHLEVPPADHQVVAWSNMDGDPVNGAVPVAPPSDEVCVTGAEDVRTAHELMAEHGGYMSHESGNPADEYAVFVLNEPLTVFEVMEGDANVLIVTGLSTGATAAEGETVTLDMWTTSALMVSKFSPRQTCHGCGSVQHGQRDELDWIGIYFVCESLLSQLR